MNYTENSARLRIYKVIYAVITLLSLILGYALKLKCQYITISIFEVKGVCSMTHKSYPPFISTALSIHK